MAAGSGQTVVFCDTKRQCDRVERALLDLGVNAAAIHGDLAQTSREKALKRFEKGEISILVATDVAARGIDIDDVSLVVHYEPPIDVKNYLHRSGRTARAGRDGWAVTLAELFSVVFASTFSHLLRCSQTTRVLPTCVNSSPNKRCSI
jgi:superfamily II DNA/RNA helicase